MFDVRLLGPVDVRRDDEPVPIPSRIQRALLARLALEPGVAVSVDRLVSDLWPDDPPSKPANALRYHVWQLRDAVEPDRPQRSEGTLIRTREPGYFLDGSAGTTDLAEVERAHAGRGADVAVLRSALDRFRGPALADVDLPFADEVRRRADELRLGLLEDRIDADLDEGAGAELVPELEAITERHPFRERLGGQLMRALVRAGRQADALDVYKRTRALLGEELGIEPSPELREIEEQVLLQTGHQPAQAGPTRRITAPLDDTIGRSDDIEEVATLLTDRRLVTLVGPPGVGKTRLATEIGAAHPADAIWLDLAALSTGSELPNSVADQLGLVMPADPSGLSFPSANAMVVSSIHEMLRDTNALVVVDNCETVLEAAADFVGTLLTAHPTVRVLTTSRVTLGVPGEHVVGVEPLDASSGESPAVQLFISRARAAGASWLDAPDSISGIRVLCDRLDGLPLALELAARRARSMDADGLVRALDERFRLLTARRGDPRRSSLEASIRSSLDLLSDDDVAGFEVLSVFAGSFTMDAAEGILSDVAVSAPAYDIVDHLVDTSLLRVVDGRFRMLDSIRDFASEGLRERERAADAIRAHAEWYLGQLEGLWARRREPRRDGVGLMWIRAERTELLTAVDRMLEADMECAATAAAGILAWYWMIDGRIADLLDVTGRVEGRCPDASARHLARLFLAMAQAHATGGETHKALAYGRRAHELALSAGDLSVAAESLIVVITPEWPAAKQYDDERWATVEELYESADDRLGLGYALVQWAWTATWDSRLEQADALLTRAAELFEDIGDDDGVANAVLGRSTVARFGGDLVKARSFTEQVRSLGKDLEGGWGRTSHGPGDIWFLQAEAELTRYEGDPEAAASLFTQILEHLEAMAPATGLMNSTRCLRAWCWRESGQHRRALVDVVECLRFLLRSTFESRWHHGTWILESAGGIMIEGFDAEIGAVLRGAADANRVRLDSPRPVQDIANADEDLRILELRLDRETIERAMERGAAMDSETATRWAIEQLEPFLD